MTRQPHRPVQEQLVDWAESSRPLPSPELARFLGPLRPVPAVASTRSWRTAVRAGLGLKVMALLAGLVVTSAAAAGIAQVALREPEPRAPVIVPNGPSESALRSAEPSGPGTSAIGGDQAPTSTPSSGPSTSATSRPRATGAPSPRTQLSHAPTPSRSAHSSTPSPEPSDGSADSSTPEPTDSVDPATPTTEDLAGGTSSG